MSSKASERGLWDSFFISPFSPTNKKSVVAEKDDEVAVARKAILWPVCGMVIVAYVAILSVAVAVHSVTGDEIPIVVGIAVQFAFLGYMTVTGTAPSRGTEALIITTAFFIIIVDFQTFGLLDLWTAFPVLINVIVVGGLSKKVLNCFTCGALVYLIFKAVEEISSIGVYSSDFTLLQEPVPEKIKISTGMLRLLTRLCTVVSAYTICHWYTKTVRHKQHLLQDSSDLAQAVAESLNTFDLEEAAYLLKTCEDLKKSKLIFALSGLLENLRLYRAYIPRHLLQGGSFREVGSTNVEPFRNSLARGVRHSLCPPPSGSVAIVFTDIQNSTSIWEQFPCAMQSALLLHNSCLRLQMHLYRGYEVKTMGDAFMTAFKSGCQAVDFACSAQVELMRQLWPKELSAHPDCNEVEGLWSGLRVRIGAHYGPCTIEENPVTRRSDYFGTTVNKAARVESSSIGGGICVTPEMIEDFNGCTSFSDNIVGEIPLKGMSDAVIIHLVTPQVLEARVPLLTIAWAARNKSTALPNVTEINILHVDETESCKRNGSSATGQILSYQDSLGKTQKSMHKVVGTVGHIDMLFSMLTNCDDFLSSLIFALDRTEGSVQCLSGSVFVADWNIGRYCNSHTHQCIRFSNFLREISSEYRYHGIRFGSSSSRGLHGSVGTERTRFLVLAGPCMLMSATAVQCCHEAGVQMIFVEMTAHSNLSSDPTLKKHLRLIDYWADCQASVYEIKPGSAATSFCMWVTDTSSSSEKLLEKNTILALCDHNSVAIEWLQSNYSHDPVILAMLSRIADFTSLRHPELANYMDTTQVASPSSSYLVSGSSSQGYQRLSQSEERHLSNVTQPLL